MCISSILTFHTGLAFTIHQIVSTFLTYCDLSVTYICLFNLYQKKVNVNFWEAECLRIDAKNKQVYCRSTKDDKEEFVVDYDYLVVAMGARVNTFNTPGVEENCLYLKVTHSYNTSSFADLGAVWLVFYKVLYE